MDKKLNVLFISGWYPTKVSPQNGDFVQRHAEAVALKHNVYVIHVITDNNIVKQHIIDNFNKNNVTTTIVYVPYYKNIFYKFYLFLNAYLNVFKELKSIDIVHLNITYPKGIIALYLKWIKKIPFIISEHSSGYKSPQNKNIGIIQKTITKHILKNAHFVCPVSESLKNEMIKFGLKGNYYPVPNVVNTDVFNVSTEYKDDYFNIIHISSMIDSIKNINGIIQVISKLENKIPNIKLQLIGHYSNLYSSKLKKLGIKNYQITNQIPHFQVANYLKNSNVFILFSNYENLPCIILESFSCGIPVISTNVGGISEYFPDNFGKLIPQKDEDKLYHEILNFYNKKYSIASKKEMHNYVMEHFGMEKICDSFSKLYYQSIKKL